MNTHPPGLWVFHANPARSSAHEDLRAGRLEVRRCVTQHRADIAPGDGAVLWLSGAAAGVYAIGEVAGGVEDDGTGQARDLDGPRDASTSCLLRWTVPLPDTPILKAELLAAGGFDQARIIRQPMGGNPLRLTPGEWEVVQALGPG